MKLLAVLLCITVTYCAWSSCYFNGDWLSGLVGGSIGCIITTFAGYLSSYLIGDTVGDN